MKRIKGITLISLVITIVILILLAGITISLTLGNNGIFNKAKLARDDYINTTGREEAMINDLYGQLQIATSGQVTVNTETLNQLIDKRIEEKILMSYPIGSIYISVDSKNPSELFGGTWESVSNGRVLQGVDDNHTADTTINAGLPNITGQLIADRNYSATPYSAAGFSGAFYTIGQSGTQYYLNGRTTGSGWYNVGFDASRSSSIYGKSNTVQPSAYVVNIWKRVS